MFRAVLKPIPGLGVCFHAWFGFGFCWHQGSKMWVAAVPWVQSPSHSSVATHRRGIIPYWFKMSNKSVRVPIMPSLSLAHFDVLVGTTRARLRSKWAAAVSSGSLFPKAGSLQQPFLLAFIHLLGGCNRLRPLFKKVLLKLVYPHLSLRLTFWCDALRSSRLLVRVWRSFAVLKDRITLDRHCGENPRIDTKTKKNQVEKCLMTIYYFPFPYCFKNNVWNF